MGWLTRHLACGNDLARPQDPFSRAIAERGTLSDPLSIPGTGDALSAHARERVLSPKRRARQLEAVYDRHTTGRDTPYGWMRRTWRRMRHRRRYQKITRYVSKNRSKILDRMRANPDMPPVSHHRVANRDLLFFKRGTVYLDMGTKDGFLGKGGFKRVTRAIDLDTLKPVAHLRSLGSGRKARDVAKESNRLDTLGPLPNLPKVIDHGKRVEHRPRKQSKGDSGYSAMQDLFAGDLSQCAADLRTRLGRLDVAIDVVRGVESLHGQGLVHKDIKPANLFVDADGRGVVGDLGMVTSSIDGWGGTRSYMHADVASMQLASSSKSSFQDLDHAKRCDVYALGLSLGETLAPHKNEVGALKKEGRAAQRALDLRSKFKGVQGARERLFAAHTATRNALLDDPNLLPEERVYLDMRHVDLGRVASASFYRAELEQIRDAVRKQDLGGLG